MILLGSGALARAHTAIGIAGEAHFVPTARERIEHEEPAGERLTHGRDELDDGGASVFAELIRKTREYVPECGIEVLIPDFKGVWWALQQLHRALVAWLGWRRREPSERTVSSWLCPA